MKMRQLVLFLFIATNLTAQAVNAPWFVKNLYPAFEKANCRTCHVTDGVAGPTKLVFPETEANDVEKEIFGLQLQRWVNTKSPAQSLLWNKPTNRIKHSGGLRIAQNSPEEKSLQVWINYLAGLSPQELLALTPVAPKRVVSPAETLRRLTHSQYNNTVRDLLGDASNPASQFPPEDFINGFKNQIQGQNLSPLLAENYAAAAEKLAASAVHRQAQELIFCQPIGPADATCRETFISKFGRRAFRRPLEPEEQTRYSRLFAAEAKRGASFWSGIEATVEAMLQSPHFLFRPERTNNPKWKAYARASRLSYFFWDTMPDPQLLDAASKGELNDPAGMERHARKMLVSERSQTGLDEFISQWFRFDRVTSQLKDRRIFPMFTRELALAMNEETRRFLQNLISSDSDFMEFVSAPYSFLNADLAQLYQIPAPSEPFTKVQFPATAIRSGILTHASVLVQTSKPVETSPTARGLFVREQLLCQHVPQPPPGVNTNLPEVKESRPMTNRQRLAEHLTNESCASCHKLIDPIGFGLEQYDATGRFQEKFIAHVAQGRPVDDKGKRDIELPIDIAGSVAGLRNSDFQNPRELGKILYESDACRSCVAKQVFRYCLGRAETRADQPVLDQALAAFTRSHFKFKELMIAIVIRSEFPQ